MPRLRAAPKKEETPKPEDAVVLTAGSSVEGPESDIVVVEDGTPEQEDASLALQKQIEELKKSEDLQRQRADKAIKDREDALKRAREREVEVSRFQKEATQSQADAISSALAAANAEAEKAQQDIENAVSIGDTKAQSEAYRRLAKAEANISKLEDGKEQIEAKVAAEKEAQQRQPQAAQDDPLERTNLPESAKTWLRSHPEYLSDPRKNSKIQALHWDILDEGHEPFSTDYFNSMEEHLGLRQAPQQQQQVQQQQQPQQRTSIVSAPVSREVPSSTPSQRNNGKITLTPEQKEYAKIAGVTQEEYAKQLIRMNAAKANGELQ